MSKIEEMADAYGRDNPFTWYDDNGEIYENTSKPAIAYSDGANAVLKEIEKILVAANEQYTTKQAVALNTEIYNKIKELKGE